MPTYKIYEKTGRTAAEIEKLTGESLEEVRNLLAAGYTLEPPKAKITMADLAALAAERDQRKKNKRRVSVLVTAQTLWHLEQEAKKDGYKDLGKTVDAIVKCYLRERRSQN